MKTTIIIILILISAFVILQSFVSRSTKKTELQKYNVLEKDGDFEIRHYPQSVMATVDMNETTYKKMSGKGFRALANYIFGGNEKEKSIAMTSPVHMQFTDTSSSMSFVMPSDYKMEKLPKPNNPQVKIHNAEEEIVAAIRYGGYSSDEDIKMYTEKLKGILEKKNIKTIGPFRYLGYNPPYEVFGRRNEVIVKIEYNKPNE